MGLLLFMSKMPVFVSFVLNSNDQIAICNVQNKSRGHPLYMVFKKKKRKKEKKPLVAFR